MEMEDSKSFASKLLVPPLLSIDAHRSIPHPALLRVPEPVSDPHEVPVQVNFPNVAKIFLIYSQSKFFVLATDGTEGF